MNEFLKKFVYSQNLQKKTIDHIKSNKKPVLIFGAGVFAYVLNAYLNALKIKVVDFLVDRSMKDTTYFIEKKPKIFEDFISTINNYNLIIGFSSYPEIIPKFKKMV